ncbi:hypothetical protein B0F90DRAFT_300806 [Multifurca ochricompacta]|uniref:Uncharacterized protein n=1 Tax=Multifurca ochricompacta TaxID=376703 RepID=A0AAD4QI45_9AGAM|nr:hypothetical protein B0F90DRAFT_300806 [Multifurca ochricompacta]
MASRKYGHSEKLDPAMSLCIPTRAMLRRIAATKAMTSSHNKTNHHHHHHLLHLHHHHHHHLLLPNHNHQHSIPPPFVFSWESWGEGRALLSKRLDRERRLPMLSRACGLRHVARKPIVYENGKAAAVFRVWDFHPGRAARTITNTTATAAIATTSTCSGGISHHHHHHHHHNGNGNGNGSAIATATATAVAVAAVDGGGNLIGHEEAILPAHVVIEVPLPRNYRLSILS